MTTTTQRPNIRQYGSRINDAGKSRLSVKNSTGNNFYERKEKGTIRTKKHSEMPDMAYEDMLNCCD